MRRGSLAKARSVLGRRRKRCHGYCDCDDRYCLGHHGYGPRIWLHGCPCNGATATAAINIAAGRDNEVATVFAAWNNNNPITFDNTPATGRASPGWLQANHGAADYQLLPVNDGHRIQYSAQIGGAMELTNLGSSQTGIELYMALLGSGIWTQGLMREGLTAWANHEKKHLEQDVQVRDDISPPVTTYGRLEALYVGGLAVLPERRD